MKIKEIIIGGLILSLTYISSFSQNESGTRYLNKERFQQQRIWFDSTTQVFQERFPIIRSIPPLSTGMPPNVLVGYIYLDSLLRFADKKVFDSLYKSWNTLNDTITGALKYMYIINDYNPIIFNQYANEVKFYHKRGLRKIKMIGESDTLNPTSGPYTLYLDDLKYRVCEKFREIYQNQNKMAYYSMLYADYILRIRIISIDSMINKNSSLGYYSYKASAFVLDTLKGKVYPVVTIQNTQAIEQSLLTQNSLFNFQFTPIHYGMFNVESQVPLYTKPDTAFLDGWKFRMLVGQEAIVFIRFHDPKYDFQYDYFDLELSQRCSLNALRIENGNVIDINNIWSSQTVISYENWKKIFLNLLNNIMNASY